MCVYLIRIPAWLEDISLRVFWRPFHYVQPRHSGRWNTQLLCNCIRPRRSCRAQANSGLLITPVKKFSLWVERHFDTPKEFALNEIWYNRWYRGWKEERSGFICNELRDVRRNWFWLGIERDNYRRQNISELEFEMILRWIGRWKRGW